MLASFIKPNQVVGPNEIIPPHILKNAKGLAVITVLKAGFLFLGRAGLGVIVARLPDGLWSPPTAIMTAGAGVGGQIGAELTDFVFILNSKAAVDSFAQAGSITLGTNVSVAAGPLGRNAEAAATASLRSALAVFAYLKTKGLFAGVSLEGLAIVERRDANRKFYGSNCKARTILAGGVETPPACEPLMRVLQSRVFNNRFPGESEIFDDDYYDDIPTDFSDLTLALLRPRSGLRGARGARYDLDEYSDDDDDGRYRTNSTRRTLQYSSKRWEDDIYDRGGVDGVTNRLGGTRILSGPARPALLKPNFGGAPKVNARQAIALYTFKGEKAGDLAFKKGDVIDIVKKTDTVDDWWTGRCNGGEGIFPANYVELI